MPVFAHIEVENDLQLDDRTRLDASKTHVTANQPAITKLSIKPGIDLVPISVYNTDAKKRFLDWEYSTWNIDIDSSNNKIDFAENGVAIVATIPSATYTLSSLCAQIITQLNAATLNAYTYSYALNTDNQLTITSTGYFDLLLSTGLNRDSSLLRRLFFGSSDLEGEKSYQSEIIESLIKKVSTIAGENKYQVDRIKCVADVAGSLNSKYFFINANGDTTNYYGYYSVSGGGVDPAITGYTGILINILTGDNATAVASATASAIDAIVDFSATSSTDTVNVTHVSYDWNTAPSEGLGTGFTFSTPTPGEKQDTESIYLNVYSEGGDYLFSSDADLMQFEPDIRRWVVDGRNSFLNVHRQAQKHIIEYIDRQGLRDTNGEKYTKFDFIDKSEVREWSRFTALRMIFEGIKSSQDDVYQQKRITYQDKEDAARNRAILSLDRTADKTLTKVRNNHTVGLFRS